MKLKNLLSESLVNSLNIQPGQVVSNPYHTAFKPMVEDETQDPQELVVGNYQTRHYDMCPGATTLYKDIESKGVDMDLAERTAKLQDVLFYMEKHVVKEMKRGTEEDVLMAKNLADQIMAMAEMMGLENEHQYIQGHVDTIEKVVADSESVNEERALYDDDYKAINNLIIKFTENRIKELRKAILARDEKKAQMTIKVLSQGLLNVRKAMRLESVK